MAECEHQFLLRGLVRLYPGVVQGRLVAYRRLASILENRPKMERMMKGMRAAMLAVIAGFLALSAMPAACLQADKPPTASRKAKFSPPPEYPELAKKQKLHGVARVSLTVAPDGKVVTVKELGGHPVLVAALVDAVKKWLYEPAARESMVEVKFEFK